MKCPKCGAVSEVIETRASANLTTTRKRRCFNDHTFKTVEVHGAVWPSAKQRAAVFTRTVARRIEHTKRNRLIAQRLHEGADKLASEFGLSRSGVFYAAKRGRK